MNLLLVALGGGTGAVCRFLLGAWIKERTTEKQIPTAMLYVNLLGSFGLGIFFGWAFQEVPYMAYDQPFFLLLGIGFFGAFTTFSTFSVEAVTLLRKKSWAPLLVYTGVTVAGCIILFLTGMVIAGASF